MGTRAERLGRMLNVTADLFFGMEEALLFHPFFKENRKKVLDLGCGNGAYMSKLKEYYPWMELKGVEMEEAMYRQALLQQDRQLNFVHGSYECLTGCGTYDAVIARLVVLHIQDRLNLTRWLSEHTQEHSVVVVIDFDDSRYLDHEKLPLYSELYRNARKSLKGKRSFLGLQDSLLLEFHHAGFLHYGTKTYSLRADRPDVRKSCGDYMRTATEYLLNRPIPQDRERELFEWEQQEDALLEIPMFGMIFGKAQEAV